MHIISMKHIAIYVLVYIRQRIGQKNIPHRWFLIICNLKYLSITYDPKNSVMQVFIYVVYAITKYMTQLAVFFKRWGSSSFCDDLFRDLPR